MKKVGSLMVLVISFLIIYNYVPVSATADIPADFINTSDLIGLQDLGYALIGGAQFNFENSPYVIEDYSSLSAAGKIEAEREAIKQFLRDYEANRGIDDYLYNECALYQGQSYYTTAFTQNAARIQEEYTLSSQNVDYAMRISPFKFADWAQYNRYWINRYSDSFNTSDDPIPSPDIDYISLINKMNNIDSTNINSFYWGDFSQVRDLGGGYTQSAITFPFYSYSWIGYSSTSTIGAQFYSDNHNQWAFPTSILSIYVSSVPGTDNYTFSLQVDRISIAGRNDFSYASFNAFEFRFDSSNWADVNSSSTPTTMYSTYTGSLQDVITYISLRFKNINLYVDNVLWCVAGAPTDLLIPDFPDVIQNEDNLAYDIPFPNTPNYDGSFDLTSLFDALKLAIIGASDQDISTPGTLTGEAVTDSYDGTDIDIQDKVVDLVSTKVFTGTLEDDTTDRLPDMVIPPGAVHAGLGGITVLSKFVDATQCILPEEIVIAFWGIFFILIILGLIKNLHR